MRKINVSLLIEISHSPTVVLIYTKVESFAEGNGYVIVAIRATITGFLIQSILLSCLKNKDLSYLGPFNGLIS
jgi:hypothetical protein